MLTRSAPRALRQAQSTIVRQCARRFMHDNHGHAHAGPVSESFGVSAYNSIEIVEACTDNLDSAVSTSPLAPYPPPTFSTRYHGLEPTSPRILSHESSMATPIYSRLGSSAMQCIRKPLRRWHTRKICSITHHSRTTMS